MHRAVLHNYAFNLSYANMLLADIRNDQMCLQSGGVANHPAWTLGHMASGSEFAALLLGLEPALPNDWRERFGRGSTPVETASAYPSKEELMAMLEKQHLRVSDAMKSVDLEFLRKPTPDDAFREIMPTVGDGLQYLLVAHEATHLGQLSCWRRTMGLPSVLG